MSNHYKDVANMEPDRAPQRMEAYTIDRNALMPAIMDAICTVNSKSIQTPGNLTNPGAQSTPDQSLVYPPSQPQDNLQHSSKAMHYMYKSAEIPTFMDPNNFAGYPKWKREWQQRIDICSCSWQKQDCWNSRFRSFLLISSCVAHLHFEVNFSPVFSIFLLI